MHLNLCYARSSVRSATACVQAYLPQRLILQAPPMPSAGDGDGPGSSSQQHSQQQQEEDGDEATSALRVAYGFEQRVKLAKLEPGKTTASSGEYAMCRHCVRAACVYVFCARTQCPVSHPVTIKTHSTYAYCFPAGSVEFTFFRLLEDRCARAKAGGVAVPKTTVPSTAESAYDAGFAPAMLIAAKASLAVEGQWLQPIAAAISMQIRAHDTLGTSAPQRMGMWAVLTDLSTWCFFHVELVVDSNGQQRTIFISRCEELTCSLRVPADRATASGAVRNQPDAIRRSARLSGAQASPAPSHAAAHHAARAPDDGTVAASTSMPSTAAAQAGPPRAEHATLEVCVCVCVAHVVLPYTCKRSQQCMPVALLHATFPRSLP